MERFDRTQSSTYAEPRDDSEVAASTQSMGMGKTRRRASREEVNRLNNPRWNRLDSGVHIHQY
jgi:hypothetical protein